ncbi:unnamed protein product [Hymenolepis diminuta]|uniref:Uncharacterized protein n=1 Tax=Hymenolepis diminuta TaxID=6216 RepID=A0A3P6ZKH7_HYMDI|nr:unnamed protein product [Hymenolepis diminuta]
MAQPSRFGIWKIRSLSRNSKSSQLPTLCSRRFQNRQSATVLHSPLMALLFSLATLITASTYDNSCSPQTKLYLLC